MLRMARYWDPTFQNVRVLRFRTGPVEWELSRRQKMNLPRGLTPFLKPQRPLPLYIHIPALNTENFRFSFGMGADNQRPSIFSGERSPEVKFGFRIQF